MAQTLDNLTYTWNSAGTTFTGIRYNVTDTASASGSLLMDLLVGGSSRFLVAKTGRVDMQGDLRNYATGGGIRQLSDTGYFAIGVSDDVVLTRDAANTLAQRNGVNAQTLRLYGTFTDASNSRRLALTSTTGGAFTLAAEGLGSGLTGNTLAFSTNGTTALVISSGQLLQVGGTTSSFPSLKRSSAALQVRLADDSADAAISASTFTSTSAPVNASAVAASGYSLTGSSAVSMVDLAGTWNTTGTPAAIKLNITDTASDAASLLMDLQTGGTSQFKVSKAGAATSVSLTTGAPSGGTAATWKLGTVASVTPTSPDRTIEVEIGGTTYYLAAKTTND
jgi:hypothetical protein